MTPISITFVAVFIKKLKIFINISQAKYGLKNLYSVGLQRVELNYISILK